MSPARRVGAAAVAVATAVLIVPRAASADQQSSVQVQMSALRDQLSATGEQVHQLTAGYASAEVRVGAIAQQVAVERVEAQRAETAVAQSGNALRQELITAYVGGYSQTAGSALAGSGPAAVGGDIANPSVRYGYLSIATSAMRDSLDSYRAAQLSLNSALSTLGAEERSARVAADAVDRARQSALAEANAAGTRLTNLEAQLTILEEKAAAQRAAAQSASSNRAPAGTVAQGGPVNGGLVALVRSQVGVSAASAPRSAPAPSPATLPAVVPTTRPPPAVSPTTAPPPTTIVAAPARTAPPAAPQPASGSGDVWLQLRECESGNDYQANTGNGFYGAYQFSQPTWTGLGYPGRPDQEPPAMQDQAAQKLQTQSGWGQWPACAAALGLT